MTATDTPSDAPAPSGKSVLVVDDDPVCRRLYDRIFREIGHDYVLAENGRAALDLLKSRHFDLIVSDIIMPEMTGVLLVEEAQEHAPGTPIIVVSGYPNLMRDQMHKGAVAAALGKPFRVAELKETVLRILAEPAPRPAADARPTRRSRRTDHQLSVLLEVAKIMNAEVDLEALLQLVMELTARLLKAERSTFFLVDWKRRELWSRVALGMGPTEIRVPIDHSLGGEAARTGKVVASEDPHADPRFFGEVDGGFVTRNLICCPVRNHRGEVIGVFEVINKRLGMFNEEDETLLYALSTNVAIAVENARLHRERERRVQDLERTNAELRRTRDQLVESEKMAVLGRLAAGIAHEVKNQMVTLAFVDLIRTRYAQDDLVQRMARNVLSARDRVLHIVDEIRNYSRPAEYQRRPGRLAAVLDEVVELMGFDQNVSRHRIMFIKEADPTIDMEADRLKQVFINLVLNAGHALESRDAGEVRIVLAEDPGRRIAGVEVADNGMGIDPVNLERIWDPFFTTHEAGTGLGLDICRKIVEGHGGTITCTSEVGAGTTFRVELPLSRTVEA